MNAEIITIGDELLIGQVIDTNSAWMGKLLNSVGINVVRKTAISDDAESISRQVRDAMKIADLVFVTGGLGPTNDDITKSVLTKLFNDELVFHQEAFNSVEGFFKQYGKEVSKVNHYQAMMPSKAKIFINDKGTASGMMFSEGQKKVFSMPGVPYEMKHLMADKFIPYLKSEYQLSSIEHRTILTQGIGESTVAERIADIEDGLENGISLAYLPSPSMVRLRLSASNKVGTDAKQRLHEVENKIVDRLKSYVFGFENDTLEAVVGRLLIEKKARVGTAESCTGGSVAKLIASVSGSSNYFNGSVVSYSNEIKQKVLDVSTESLSKYGAVSEEVVKEMCAGALSVLDVDYAISTSGIAGPNGGTEEKPVGTVWIAVGSKGQIVAKKFQFGDNRERNIIRASSTALNMLRRFLMGEI